MIVVRYLLQRCMWRALKVVKRKIRWSIRSIRFWVHIIVVKLNIQFKYKLCGSHRCRNTFLQSFEYLLKAVIFIRNKKIAIKKNYCISRRFISRRFQICKKKFWKKVRPSLGPMVPRSIDTYPTFWSLFLVLTVGFQMLIS